MATTATYLVTNLRTGFTEDGLLELQLIYDGGRGGSVWFQLTKAQQTKLDRDLWSRRDAERASRGEQTRLPLQPRDGDRAENGWHYWDGGE